MRRSMSCRQRPDAREDPCDHAVRLRRRPSEVPAGQPADPGAPAGRAQPVRAARRGAGRPRGPAHPGHRLRGGRAALRPADGTATVARGAGRVGDDAGRPPAAGGPGRRQRPAVPASGLRRRGGGQRPRPPRRPGGGAPRGPPGPRPRGDLRRGHGQPFRLTRAGPRLAAAPGQLRRRGRARPGGVGLRPGPGRALGRAPGATARPGRGPRLPDRPLRAPPGRRHRRRAGDDPGDHHQAGRPDLRPQHVNSVEDPGGPWP
jgi:hypothetical protein